MTTEEYLTKNTWVLTYHDHKNELWRPCDYIERGKIKSLKDLWELCSDAKNEMIDAIAMSMPLHDKGLLGSLRVSNIHKIMCLKKFEDYITSPIHVRGLCELTLVALEKRISGVLNLGAHNACSKYEFGRGLAEFDSSLFSCVRDVFISPIFSITFSMVD